MAAEDISDLMEQAYGLDRVLRARMFMCCVTGDHIMVMTGNQKSPSDKDHPDSHFFVPTVCGDCERRAGGNGGKSAHLELKESLLQSWDTYKVVSKYCGEVRIVT